MKFMEFMKQEAEANKQGNTSTSSANMAGTFGSINPWVIDSGATEHIACDKDLLESLRNIDLGPPVKIPDGTSVPVKSVGSARLLNGIKLERVLYIPEFKCNLVSVDRLIRELNCILIFFRDFCVIQDLSSRNLIGVGHHRDGLYYFQPAHKEGSAFSVTVDLDLWHRRLRHASGGKL